MDLLIILTYVAIAWSIFKIFKIPVNKWTVPTAALGGVFIVSALILLMNYNHPYTFLAQKAVISIPITPQVTGVVNSVTDKANQRVKKGEVLFTIDPARYQARVDRLQADLVTALHSINTLKAQLSGNPGQHHPRVGGTRSLIQGLSALPEREPGAGEPVLGKRHR